MKEILNKHKWKIIGLLAGALGGYLYYHFVGCTTGTCPITSNPWRMILYGALIGLLLFNIFTPETPKKTDNPSAENS